jgi:hypothetical protein
MGAMGIIQHPDCFEVRSEDGSIIEQFAFDDNARRRALGEDDQETGLPSRQDFCRQELYGRNGEAVTIGIVPAFLIRAPIACL